MTTLAEGQRLGPYRIVRLLGTGGMGAVYEARQEPLDRRVALKTLHPEYASNKEAVARFFNEAKALSRLEHPSIVQVSDFGNAADGTAYLVMEYLRGQSLGRRLRDLAARGDRLPIVTAMQVGFQTADVLAVAHAQGIVHRDIKPDNLMLIVDAVAPGGERVKLLDFGIAKLTRLDDKGDVKTATQAVMGTPSYMSPEQCSGAGGVDARTDVYALGCVLFEMLAGRAPFLAEGAGQLIGMHLFQQPPPLRSLAPKVPESIAELVHRLLTKDKAQRPTMDEAADDLGTLLPKIPGGAAVLRSRPLGATDPNAGQVTVIQPPVTTLGRSIGQQSGRVPRLSVVAGVCVTVLIGSGLLVGWRQTAQRTPQIPPTKAAQTAPRSLVTAPSAATPPVAAAQPAGAEEPRSITWNIDSDPSGGTVFDEAGQNLGTTPLVKSRSAEPGQSVLRLHQEGYTDAKITVSRERSETQRITLTRATLIVPSRDAPRPAPQKKATNPPTPKPAQPVVGKSIGYEKD